MEDFERVDSSDIFSRRHDTTPPADEQQYLKALISKNPNFLQEQGFTGKISSQGYLELKTGGFSTKKPSEILLRRQAA